MGVWAPWASVPCGGGAGAPLFAGPALIARVGPVRRRRRPLAGLARCRLVLGGGGGEVPRRPWIRHVGVWWRQRLVVWVEWLSLAGLGPGGPFGVDVVAGGVRIRFLIRGGWLVRGEVAPGGRWGITYDFMKSPDPKIIVAADAKKPTETVAARAFSLAESNFWLRNLKIRDYEALFARTIEDTNHPHLFNHDTPLGTAPKSRKRSITSQKATIWPFFAIFSSENTFYLVPRGCGSIKGVPWNHLTISKT